MNYTITELIPADRRKSFYGKAVQIQRGRTYFLKSYSTIVCSITPSGKIKRYWDGWSATTARHVDSFLHAHDLPGLNKKQWLSIPVSNVVRDYYSERKPRKASGADLSPADSLRIMYARRRMDGVNY